jgi:hypothetical protein
MTRLTQHSEITTGIIFDDHTEVARAFIVFFDALNDGDLAAQSQVQNVAAFLWTQANAIANLHDFPVNFNLVND